VSREIRQHEHGVNLLAALVKRVAKTLDEDFDIEILEMHHNKKVDAPSGTALMLAARLRRAAASTLISVRCAGRDGTTGARCAGDIGFASLRGGSVVGDHTVIFAGPAERIELMHRAEDRMIFARGALRAALWARGRKPGLYSMADVLGLSDIDRSRGPRAEAIDPSSRSAGTSPSTRAKWGRHPRAALANEILPPPSSSTGTGLVV